MANDALEQHGHDEALAHADAHGALAESPLHESSEIPLSPIVKFVVVLFVVMFASMVAMGLLYKIWYDRFGEIAVDASPLSTIEQPRGDTKLQVDEPTALALYNEENEKALEARGAEKISIESAMEKIAEAGRLPGGPDWSLKPDEKIIGGVIMNAEQVQYANTPPSQAPAGSPAPTAADVPKAAPAPAPNPAAATGPEAAPKAAAAKPAGQ